MNRENFINPNNKWEIPVIILLLGLSVTYIGLIYNINILSYSGIILVILSTIKIIKIRIRSINSRIKEEDPRTDPKNMNWESHGGKFHKIR